MTEHIVVADRYTWLFPEPAAIRIGSDRHRDLFCSLLLQTFDPYKPAVIAWPALDEAAIKRLTGLPFWDTAVSIEARAAFRMQAQANQTADSLIREALCLNAFEEDRHRHVLGHMLRFYHIPVDAEVSFAEKADAEWGFLRTGFGECINSFIAFGLFDLARRSGFFPQPLVDTFEPVIQEEARHIMFFVNWVAYRRANLPLWRKPLFVAKCLAAVGEQFLARMTTGLQMRRLKIRKDTQDKSAQDKGGKALGAGKSNFLADSRTMMAGRPSKGDFMRLCLAEQERRMAGYDRRLLRPMMMPRIARLLLKILP